MADERRLDRDADGPTFYWIRLKGHLGRQRMDWFEGLTIMLEQDGTTLLTGPLVDQAALHGILRRIRDLGMPLLSVISNETGPQDEGVNNPAAGDP